MKKILMCLLAVALLLTMIPAASAAADVKLNFTVATYDIAEDYDMLEEDGAFGLQISASGAKFSGGSIGIAYDPSVVVPGYIGRRGFVEAADDEAADIVYSDMVEGVAVTMGTQFLNTEKGYIVINIAKETSIKFDDMTGEDALTALTFSFVGDNTIDSLTNSTFSAIPADDQYLVDCQVKANGGAGVFKDNNSVVYTTDAGTLAMAFNIVEGGDIPDEPEEEVFEITKTESAVAGTDTMKDADGKDVTAAGDEVVAIFAKNVTDAELAAGTYGIVFGGVRYAGQAVVPAKTAWAIKLVGSADQLPAGSYAYSIFAGDAVVEATAPWVID